MSEAFSAPLIPADEKERLAALLQLRMLDTPAEERFDRITRTARDLFQVPISLISLVDANRQWFKSRTGLDACETPRAVSFCGHAILGTDPFVVENALTDPRFSDNPLVTGPPGVHFYAGMPLLSTTGKALGTLCLIDHMPRRFGADDAARLHDLAAWAERELNLFVEIESAISEMRETFVRLVSHELRTPVTRIVGALELLRSDSVVGISIEALSRIAVDGARQLHRIVDDIVELGELDAGQQEVTPSRIELRLFIEAVMEHTAAVASQAGVGMTIEASSDMVVQAVPKKLGRILRTLLDSALRFSPPDTSIAIVVTSSNQNMVRISITDQGPGIPAEHLSNAQDGASYTHSYNGFGASLAICRRLATAMGGRLEYESTAGGGHWFFLELPQ